MIVVVIPCFRVKEHILDVVSRIGKEVSMIYLVDDACQQHTGRFVENHCQDERLRVLYNQTNLGVGGAVVTAYGQVLADFANITEQPKNDKHQRETQDPVITVVKLDGDGQVDPALIGDLVAPLIRGEADYAKGNRFLGKESLKLMPPQRIAANYLLSQACRLLTGYRHIMDPANGFTAISYNELQRLTLSKLDKGYFFETDMLFHLARLGARVVDYPMKAVYNKETSGLNIWRQLPVFAWKLTKRSMQYKVY